MSASSHIWRVTFACGSSVMPIGISGPTTERRRASNSPSPSWQKSVTIAPCRLKRIPSSCSLCVPRSVDDDISHAIERVTRHKSGRLRSCADRMDDLPIVRPRDVEKSRNAGVGMASFHDGFVARIPVARAEGCEVRGARAEGVGLVENSAVRTVKGMSNLQWGVSRWDGGRRCVAVAVL